MTSTLHQAAQDTEEWLAIERLKPLYVPSEYTSSVYSLRNKAAEMGIGYPSAVKMRARYLLAQWELCEEWLEGDNAMPQMTTGECLDELSALVRSLKVAPKGDITPEMKERANEYPVTRLIEFKHGRALAWCHKDKSPSLTYMSKTNQAWCSACDLWFDAIAVQRELAGQSFKDAVRALCN